MQHVLSDELIRRALRARICPTCSLRPVGSESMGPLQPRSCEGACTIFENLEPLQRVAQQCEGNPLAAFEHAIQESVCQHCNAAPTAGDYCTERLGRTCPLSVQAARVVAVIESLLPPIAKCG